MLTIVHPMVLTNSDCKPILKILLQAITNHKLTLQTDKPSIKLQSLKFLHI